MSDSSRKLFVNIVVRDPDCHHFEVFWMDQAHVQESPEHASTAHA